MPGGSAHTAGGTPADGGVKVTYWEALKTIRPSDYLTFHKKPCVRDGQLTGIGTGFAFGGIAAVLRKPVYTCCSWAVWSYVSTSIIAYQWCQNQRAKERAGIREAMKIMEEKRQNVEAKREARRKAIEEARRLEEERKLAEQRRSWSFWAKNNLKFW
jgi:cytochrome c oxidase assembly protein subunit 20